MIVAWQEAWYALVAAFRETWFALVRRNRRRPRPIPPVADLWHISALEHELGLVSNGEHKTNCAICNPPGVFGISAKEASMRMERIRAARRSLGTDRGARIKPPWEIEGDAWYPKNVREEPIVARRYTEDPGFG